MKGTVSSKHKDRRATIAILDAGAQYGFDIEQAVKLAGYPAERLAFDTPAKILKTYGAIILSGGPQSVYGPRAPKYDADLFSLNKPLLGICYGMHLINHALGGTVAKLPRREDGFTKIQLDDTVQLFRGLQRQEVFIMSHGDSIATMAPGLQAIAHSGNIIAGIQSRDKPIVGVQFHPEVSANTGQQVLKNFLNLTAQLMPSYTYNIEQVRQDIIAQIREEAGNREVLAFVSGGVDSDTLARMLEEALPKSQTHLVYVDTGLMRANESTEVQKLLGAAGINLQVYDAVEIFHNATTTYKGKSTQPLYSEIDPEKKRAIIGDTFIKLQRAIADELGLDKDRYLLAQGTLYTDLIESGSKVASGQADTIKTHHNDSPLARELREAGRVIEPFRHLQKQGVRELAAHVGLSDEIVWRQPFPGPGLAVRIICAGKAYSSRDAEQLDRQLKRYSTPRLRALLLPVRTVGVQGDGRSYSQLVGLSGTSTWSELVRVANEIPRTIHSVNRVVYVWGEPVQPEQISLTPTTLLPEVIEQLRQADRQVNHVLRKYALQRSITQVPVVLFPVSFDTPGKRSVGIRTIMTTDFKTGTVAVPGIDFPESVISELVAAVLAVPGISRVAYDLTSKPPATTEWE